MLGDLQDFSLPDLFQMFRKAQKSGQLSIWTPQGIFRIGLYQGRLISIISPDWQMRLKSLLFKDQPLSPKSAVSLPNMSLLEEPLGTYLSKKELVSPQQLTQVFRQQLQQVLYPLFTLTTGQFRFASNVPIPFEEITGLSKDAIEVAIEALRFIEDTREDYEHLPQPDGSFVRTAKDLPTLNLSPNEWSVLERINPDIAVCEIAAQLLLDLLEVRKICARLEKVGLIQPLTAASAKTSLASSVPTGKSQVTEFANSNASPQVAEKINLTLFNRLTAVLRSKR
jgi:DNA-binding MarR family transcriptional regulator